MPCLIALLVWFAGAIGIGWFLARAAALADRRAPHPPARPSAPGGASDAAGAAPNTLPRARPDEP